MARNWNTEKWNNMETRKKSVEFFRVPPMFYSCAQSVLLGFKDEFGITDKEIQDFAAFMAGKAPNGYCGALHAAIYLLEKKGVDIEKVKEEFKKVAGALTCKDIKGVAKFPCHSCVVLADEIVERYSK